MERICFSGSKCIDVKPVMMLLNTNNRKTDVSNKETHCLKTEDRDKAGSGW